MPRTFKLAMPNVIIFQKYCSKKGKPAQEVVDSLIAAFLEKSKDDKDLVDIIAREAEQRKG